MCKIDLKSYKKVYFIGIGGISMSGLAKILDHRGVCVLGSDANKSDATTDLEKSNIKVFYGHNKENITSDIDLIVYTAAVKEDNPEIIEAKNKNIQIIERSQLLGAIMDLYSQSIAVSGTHGKTTTTSIISEILLACNTDPTITVGGVLPSIGGNIRIGSSNVFLAEACEYHGSFLKFNPYIGIILNVEADHMDYFKNLDEIIQIFKDFAEKIPEEGYIIINNSTLGKDYITENLNSKVITYGFEENCDCIGSNISYNPDGSSNFDITFMGTFVGTLTLNVPGEHNILNALAAFAAANVLGLNTNNILKGISNYTGVNRRFQKKGKFENITIIDDYAHHPTEVRVTLAAARKTGHKKTTCIFQPHTYTRLKELFDDFTNCFDDADEIIVPDIYAAREKDPKNIHSKDLVDALLKKGKNAKYMADFGSIVDYIVSTSNQHDLLITMGAGNVYTIGETLANK